MEYLFHDVNDAFHVMYNRFMTNDGIMVRDSRNGPVRESRTPVILNYTRPRRRVLFNTDRDANPFFHVFESVWMLAGRNDLKFLEKFLPRMRQYSDDGKTLISAYGARWSEHLRYVIRRLKKDPNSRRTFIPIFEPGDVRLEGNDMPCNTGISFYIRDGYLDMAVFNRSNDLIWGSLGANVVHFSFLHEYTARCLNVPMGVYSQISSCLHLYTEFDITKKLEGKIGPMPTMSYDSLGLRPPLDHIMQIGPEEWMDDAAMFMDDYVKMDYEHLEKYGAPEKKIYQWKEPFFEHVIVPMYHAWSCWKHAKDFEKASFWTSRIWAQDWRFAAREWIHRRMLKASAEQVQGE